MHNPQIFHSRVKEMAVSKIAILTVILSLAIIGYSRPNIEEKSVAEKERDEVTF